jgi:hypothetical protein
MNNEIQSIYVEEAAVSCNCGHCAPRTSSICHRQVMRVLLLLPKRNPDVEVYKV